MTRLLRGIFCLSLVTIVFAIAASAAEDVDGQDAPRADQEGKQRPDQPAANVTFSPRPLYVGAREGVDPPVDVTPTLTQVAWADVTFVSADATKFTVTKLADKVRIVGKAATDKDGVELQAKVGDKIIGKVSVIVFKVELEKCANAFLPMGGSEDNTTTIRAFVTPDTVKGTFKFTLFEVSDEPGYSMNNPDTVPATGEDSDAWKDIQFPSQTGFTVSGSNNETAETTANNLNEATVTVKSFDYGAYGKIKVEFVEQSGGTPCIGKEQGGTKEHTNLPLDDDGNNIADSWAHNTGNAADDDDTSLNNTSNGDGLTRYEEYRGVDIDNNDRIAAAERLDPSRKDLFVQGSGFGGGDFPAFSYGDAFDEAKISLHDFSGTVGDDDRNIDVLVVTVKDQGGHIYRRGAPYAPGVRDWVWSTLGQSTVGTANAYGSPEINKKANNYYFSDKPHKDGKTWNAPGQWTDPANGELDPVNPERVEDTDDDGVLDANEKDGAASAPTDDGDDDFDGDHPVKDGASWDYEQDLSPMDIDANGKVELPRDSQVPVTAADEYTKAQIVQHVVTHEMGHAVGIFGPHGGHCNDSTCLMYRYNNDRKRDGHFCNDCRGMIHIHND